VRRPAQQRIAAPGPDRGAPGEVEGGAREQDAAGARERGHARGDALRQPLDLERLGAPPHVGVAVLAQHDLAEVDARARAERNARLLPERMDAALVVEREAHGLDRPLEEQQEAVALVDLAPLVRAQELARGAVVSRKEVGRGLVPRSLHEARAGDQVADQQRADRRGRRGCHRGLAQADPAQGRVSPRGAGPTRGGAGGRVWSRREPPRGAGRKQRTSGKTVLFIALGACVLPFVASWVRLLRRGADARPPRPDARGAGVGFVTNFFDTLGIGSFATTTSVWKFLGSIDDRVIPGTLNVGHALPTVAQAVIYIALIEVELTSG
jgi:hypothetical protein